MNGYDEKHQTEVKRLRSQLLEVSEEKEREIEARKAMEGDLRNRIVDFSKRIAALEYELADKKHTNVKRVNTCLFRRIKMIWKHCNSVTIFKICSS